MRQDEIIEGGTYITNQGKVLRVDRVGRNERASWPGSHATIRYFCTNLATGRQVIVKSALKFHHEAGRKPEKGDHKHGTE